MKNKRAWVAMALGWAILSAPSYALDGVSVEIGGGDGVDMGRIGAQWDWKTRWLQGQQWHVGGYWDFALGYWHRSSAPGLNEEVFEVAVTPVLRLQPNALQGPYLEAGIGVHLLSDSSIGDKRLSTAVQFGSHLGAGYRFGPKGAYDIGYRFQHLSNAGMKHPNPGINFHQLRLQYHF